MPVAHHQTMRLGRGRHRSPGDGACAMELASLLAGAPFSDRCDAVCPMIAAFVRGYNDHIGDRRRQELIPLVPDLLDTRADDAVTRERAERCLALGRRLYPELALRLPWGPRFSYPHLSMNVEYAGAIAGRAGRHRAGAHRGALAFVRELAYAAPTGAVRRATSARTTGATCVPNSSIERSTSACETAPTLI